ncbi:MAG: OmpA family protein, partial [Bacteroidales bacterium]|nr:OmpA family protein [Bacteroidales bacterium]
MKYSTILGLIVAVLFLSAPDASAQIKINLKEKINKEANRRANRKADKGVQKSFDGLEKGVKGLFTKEDSAAAAQQQAVKQAEAQGQATGANKASGVAVAKNPDKALALNWSKYDFVPGDKIIFEDNLMFEENGEFPSRWDLHQGTIENAAFGGDNVIMFRSAQSRIVPYLKNPTIDYLPEIFTIEFDLFLYGGGLRVSFSDLKNQRPPHGQKDLNIGGQDMYLPPAQSDLPNGGSIKNRWAHISIAYTNGKMKAYIDETRLINIPHFPTNPQGVSLYAGWASDKNPVYIKNIRIAEGGVKYYDRFLQNGKIVSNGIRFDVGKASLRPESMGVLNEIYKMLSEHSEVNVSIEGHTDSDGDFAFNQKLSAERAKTVMD